MIAYAVRRLGQSVATIFGVMLLSFLLFRAMPGDIAAAHKGQKATQQDRADWLYAHGYDRPLLVNYHRRLVIADTTEGKQPFSASDPEDSGSMAADALALFVAKADEGGAEKGRRLLGRYVWDLCENTQIEQLTKGLPMVVEAEPVAESARAPATTTKPAAGPRPVVAFSLADGTTIKVDLTGVRTCGELIERINDHPDNEGKMVAGMTKWSAGRLLESQFVDHFVKSVTFRARSLETNARLTDVIAERAPRSLALTVPALAIGWLAGLLVSCFVAYFRGTVIDRIGVFLCVLGMCIPFLAFMIYGQWFMFHVAPSRAYGTLHRTNIYVPILIMVVAGLGGSVRFYRTVILDEVNRDYVRTALAKGAPLPQVLFKHVLKNCMLPILTNLIMAIPFLILGSLLVESYFGIAGLGDLMITSINKRDEPIMNAMVFLTAAIYTFGVTLTDISYAVFDPRIRLK